MPGFFRTPASEDQEPSPPRWPALLGFVKVVQTVGRFLVARLKNIGEGIRMSPIWVPRLFAFLLAPLFLILFFLRNLGGAYEKVETRVGKYTWRKENIDTSDPVGPVDFAAMVKRRYAAQWLGSSYETEDPEVIILAVILWLYTAAWVVLGIVALVWSPSC